MPRLNCPRHGNRCPDECLYLQGAISAAESAREWPPLASDDWR